MKNEIVSNIKSYKDLKLAKKRLKLEIRQQEESFKNNPVFNIATSLFGSNKQSNVFKKPLSFVSNKNSFSFSKDHDLKSIAENILSTILISNKVTRKYFIAFTIAKEMVPFTLQKVNELLRK